MIYFWVFLETEGHCQTSEYASEYDRLTETLKKAFFSTVSWIGKDCSLCPAGHTSPNISVIKPWK